MKYKYLLLLSSIIAFLFMVVLPLHCQSFIPPDKLPWEEEPALKTVNIDSLQTSAKLDSLFYAADSIAYNYNKEQIKLFGNTSINYQNSTIQCDSILINLKNKQAYTYGKTIMQDGDQILIGADVYYDVNSETGFMNTGLSKVEKGFYYGDEIRKIDKNVYDIDGGRFTTCDDAEPHFYIWSKQMRLIRNDKVIGKPVVFYVNHFPVMYFPFATFSIRRGRHAGFLMPEPGYNQVDGKTLRNIAWYYPYKDYADFIAALDITEKSGWKANINTQYLKRYEYNGNLGYTLQHKTSGATTTSDWSLVGVHHQDLPDKASVDVNVNFISNKRIWESSNDINENLAQQISSSLSYRKPLLSSYLNGGLTYTQDLINNYISVNLPSLSFTLPTRPVAEIFSTADKSINKDYWWNNFNYSYGVRMEHTGIVKDSTRSFFDILWDNKINPNDTTHTSYLNEHHAGVKQNVGLSFNWKLLRWINMSQGMNYNEAWFDRNRENIKWVRGYDYNAYASANFNIYGVKTFNNFYLRAIRHIITPSMSFSWSPNFQNNKDLYNFGSIGVNTGKKSRFVSMSLDQKWQIKYGKDKATEKKLNDLVSWHIGANADLEKKKDQLSQITHSLNFRPGQLDLGKTNITYSAQLSATQNPDDISWTSCKFRNHYFSHTIGISGSAPYTDYFPHQKNTLFNPYIQTDSSNIELSHNIATQQDWSISVSQDLRSPNDLIHPTNNNLRISTSSKITTNWSVTYANYYDVIKGDLLSQSFELSRDMHCWKLNISYTRRNEYWDYRISFFNLALPDALRLQTHDSKHY